MLNHKVVDLARLVAKIVGPNYWILEVTFAKFCKVIEVVVSNLLKPEVGSLLN